jgi:hypothetical protein
MPRKPSRPRTAPAGAWRATALFAATALVLTWPLPLHLASRIPLGGEPTPTVPYFNLWTLGWNATWFATEQASYWNAPIFHPVPGTFAFSDPQPLAGLVAAPLWRLNRAAAYNLVLLLFLTFNGLAVHRLLRHRGFGWWPAALGGLLVQALPFLTHERGVLQLQPLFGVVWGVDALWSLAERPGWRPGLELGFAAGITFLVSEYYGFFLPLVLAPALLVLLPRLAGRRAGLALALAAVVTLALILPIGLPQAQRLRLMGFSRGAETIQSHSAEPDDYLKTSSLLASRQLLTTTKHGGHPLSPGLALLLLGVAGAYRGVRSRAERSWTLFLLSAAALTLVVSLGPNLALGNLRPYTFLQTLLPGFESLRSPFRLGVIVQLVAALLAAGLLRDLFDRGHRRAALAFAALALVELVPAPVRLVPIPATLAPGQLEGPALFLPYVEGSRAADYAETAAVMLASLPARLTLVNGYSGYFPQLNHQLKEVLDDFPSERGLAALRALGVETLLIEIQQLSAGQQRRLTAAIEGGSLKVLGETMEVHVFELHGTEFRPASRYQGRWTVERSITSTGLELLLTPTDLGQRIYVAAPDVAPLSWRVRVIAPDDSTWEQLITTPGAFLLYSGSHHRPIVRLKRPAAQGLHTIQVLEPADQRVLAETRVVIRRPD